MERTTALSRLRERVLWELFEPSGIKVDQPEGATFMTKQRSEKAKGEADISTVELSENELEKAAGGSRSASEPSISEITITKRMDKASTKLFMD
jgi:type VI protein secretion system component Hcp